MKPLEGLLVIDFSQFLSGPSASLRLADLGARVIKIERPDKGDLCRQLYISNLELDGDSTLFHSINRNKQSFAADLKNAGDLARIRKLLARADVMIQNFRPGVIEKIGLGYDAVRELNPRLVYGEITGYGNAGPWRTKPGQDLLVQSLSGLPYLNGDATQPPVPFGLAVSDMMAGAHLVQGVLATLLRRSITGVGGKVEVSLLESTLDLQFEVLSTYLNDGGKAPQRSAVNNAHAYLGAALMTYVDPASLFDQRDEIKSILVHHLKQQSTAHWLSILEPADVWCADVLTWDRLFAHDGFKALGMVQTVDSRPGAEMRTTRCPIRIDGEVLTSPLAAPRIGEHNGIVSDEFDL